MDEVQGSRKPGRKLPVLGAMMLGVALTLIYSAEPTGAAERRNGGAIISETSEVQKVRVTINKSRTFKVERPFATIVAGNPDIADVKPLGDRTIYVLGKQTGTTNIVLFDDAARQIGVLDVEVTIDTGSLQQNILGSTGSGGIRVRSTEGQVILTGTAVDAVAAEKAMAIATGSAPRGAVVVNAMNVAAPQQVMLEVRFLEANRLAAGNSA